MNNLEYCKRFALRRAVFIMILLTELQQYVISTAITRQLMKCHVPIFVLFTPMFLDSLEMLHCQRNKPLYVFPYGEKMTRNSLIEVSLKKIRRLRNEAKLLINKHPLAIEQLRYSIHTYILI